MNETDQRTYIAIDLKSFYASVECMDLGLDPLTTNLVVADASRTEKTICLAVSPSLKAYGIPGRARLFEVVQRMKEVNRERKRRLGPGAVFSGKSSSAPDLAADPSLEADYLVAVPRMSFYIEWSTKIYEIYLRFIAPEDMHVYSIDEVFIDATKYLPLYGKSAHDLAMDMVRAVLKETGITATAGIGTNLYLAKIAMDVEAKHIAPDADGVRIAQLDEMSYRKKLWGHRPITDFWRVGRGYANRLARHGIFTMGDVARCSVQDEDLLYSLFGVNAELLIDHAWGWEPCTMDLIHSYTPQARSFSSGQVLTCPYEAAGARIVVREMAEAAALDLVEKQLLTDQMVLTVGYDIENLSDPARRRAYRGPVHTDRYGRRVPKAAHGTANLPGPTSSADRIVRAVLDLYDRIVDPGLLVRRIYLNTNHVTVREEHAEPAGTTGRRAAAFEGVPSWNGGRRGHRADPAAFEDIPSDPAGSPDRRHPAQTRGGGGFSQDPDLPDSREGQEALGKWEQLDLFTDYEARKEEEKREQAAMEKERRLQEAMLEIRSKFGKNAILKGTSLQEGATMRDRNQSIGGHKA